MIMKSLIENLVFYSVCFLRFNCCNSIVLSDLLGFCFSLAQSGRLSSTLTFKCLLLKYSVWGIADDY